eukprot:s4329_g1.t1
MTGGISLPLRVRPGAPTPRRRGGWRLCLLAAAPRALATSFTCAMSGGPERSVVLAVTPLHVWSGLSALLPQAYHTSLLIDQTDGGEYWFNANGVAVSRFSSHAGLGGVTQLLDMGTTQVS